MVGSKTRDVQHDGGDLEVAPIRLIVMPHSQRCPACSEPVSITVLECPLCGEFIRSRDEARVLEHKTNVDALPLDAEDKFFATFIAGAELRGALLGGADLFHADLAGADLRGADLGHALLSAADLSQADLTGSNLFRADLTEANMCGTDLREANLIGADLCGAFYDARTIFPDDFDPVRAGMISRK